MQWLMQEMKVHKLNSITVCNWMTKEVNIFLYKYGHWSPIMFIIIKFKASNNKGQMIWMMYVASVIVMISTVGTQM